MEKKFAPGPWKSQVCENGFEFEIVGPRHVDEDDCEYIAVICDGLQNADTEFQAHLIAAAPELLEALENVLSYIDTDDMKELNLNLARTAIDKAYGKETP